MGAEGQYRTLQEAIAVCQVPSLAKEMQRVIDKVNSLPARARQGAQPLSSSSEGHVLLNRYNEIEPTRSQPNTPSAPKKR